MKIKYIITGAAGNLGLNIINELLKTNQPEELRAFVLTGDKNEIHIPKGIEKIYGDIRNEKDIEKLFTECEPENVTVIHTAGIVTIYGKYNKTVYNVNVGGTRNIVRLCVENKVRKLIYVSSVHAIPSLKKGSIITEISDFNPDAVKGFYAKTKAEASKIVTEAVINEGLNANIVFPSGLCGPGDYQHGHITQLLIDCVTGKLPAGIDGGYDFSDVRDVAKGIISVSEKSESGENYILGNRYVSIPEILRCVHEITGARLIKRIFPISFAMLAAPFFEAYYKRKKRPPLFTPYSLYTLKSNSMFSSEKAKKELGYKTRPFKETIKDTLDWLKQQGISNDLYKKRKKSIITE